MRGLTTGFPATREALFDYDALVIANLEGDFFTRRNWRWQRILSASAADSARVPLRWPQSAVQHMMHPGETRSRLAD